MTVEIDRSKVQAEPISFICFNLSKYALSCLWGWGWSGGIGGADAVEGVGVGECLLSGWGGESGVQVGDSDLSLKEWFSQPLDTWDELERTKHETNLLALLHITNRPHSNLPSKLMTHNRRRNTRMVHASANLREHDMSEWLKGAVVREQDVIVPLEASEEGCKEGRRQLMKEGVENGWYG
jgi:hypothetical protein